MAVSWRLLRTDLMMLVFCDAGYIDLLISIPV